MCAECEPFLDCLDAMQPSVRHDGAINREDGSAARCSCHSSQRNSGTLQLALLFTDLETSQSGQAMLKMVSAGQYCKLTLASRLQDIASFLTSSMVGSRCFLYFARGCQRSYWACKALPARSAGGSKHLSQSPKVDKKQASKVPQPLGVHKFSIETLVGSYSDHSEGTGKQGPLMLGICCLRRAQPE